MNSDIRRLLQPKVSLSTPRGPFVAMFLLSLSFCQLQADNWPLWRGPHGNGVCDERTLPLHWDTNKNVRWKTALPDRGNSTPVVWGQKVFVTQSIEKERNRQLDCYNRADGSFLWKATVPFKEKELTHDTNPFASSSPVTDGSRVIVWYGSAGLFCYDMGGKELWRKDLGMQRHIWGYGGSPVLFGNLCILNFGPGERSFLIALDKVTGKTVWQVNEPGGHSGEKKPEDKENVWVGSWTTPLLVNERETDALIVSWPGRVAAYDPAAGREIWTCQGLNPLAYASPLYSQGIVVAMGGFNGSAFAVKTGGSGDVTESLRLWRQPRARQRIGSGVIHGDHVYMPSDNGIAECFEVSTGKMIWEERLAGPSKVGSSWSSMVLVGDRIYVPNQGGDTFVLKASPKFEVLAVNPLFEKTLSSMAVSDGAIFIRTYQHLWCIQEKP